MSNDKKMKAIVLPEYNQNIIRALRSLQIVKKPIPKPETNQVLVKLEGSPCNPSDLAFIQGGYNVTKNLPAVPGFEGTGIVVDTGPHPSAKNLLGKKVSCFVQEDTDGTWAEYFIARSRNCIHVKKKLPMEQAASLCVNPFTAYVMLDMAKKKKKKAIIQNAAAGQIGVFIQRLARLEDMTVINIVRKDKHINYLQSLGEKIAINQNDEHFERDLSDLAHKFDATIAFDAVGGKLTGSIIHAMPPGSELVLYGGLSGTLTGPVKSLDIIFHNKKIYGFNLTEWLSKISKSNFQKISDQLQYMIIAQEIRTRVQQKVRLDDFGSGLLQYIKNMSDGKVLFIP